MDALDRKINEVFPGKVVRKDLTALLRRGANVPTFVLEYLLGMYCATDDETAIAEGVEKIRKILAENYVRPEESEKVKSLIRERGEYTVIDKVSAVLDEYKDIYVARFSNLEIEPFVLQSDYAVKYTKILMGGIWCIARIGYTYQQDSMEDEKKRRKKRGPEDSPFRILGLKPIQLPNLDAAEMIDKRKEFTTEEWIAMLLRSEGMEPDALSEKEKLHFIERMVPLAEHNYNLCELGPRGTGKSHLLLHMAASLARQGLRVILALEEQTAPLFWQQAEALFLDDIQTLGGQPRSQRLLAALLAHRPEKAPVVLALEGGPDALGAWEPGPAASVRQLFSAELTPPDMEARMRYLQQCCRENALDLPREHLRLMARRAAHFHGLRSLLLRVKSAWEDDAARHPSLDDLERLARTGPVQACHAGHEQILAEAARCCDAAPADITGTGRHARLVMARQAAMYVCRRHLGLSYPELGRAFGGRDHSTVIHAVKKIGKMLESNKDVQHLVARLEKCAHQEQPDSSPTDEVFGA